MLEIVMYQMEYLSPVNVINLGEIVFSQSSEFIDAVRSEIWDVDVALIETDFSTHQLQ